jgi:hypothetical protein
MKKILLLILTAHLYLSIMPVNAQAACDKKAAKGLVIDDTDRTSYKKLKCFKYNRYLNKQSIDVLMQKIGMVYVNHRFITVRVKNLRGVQFFINDNLSIEVFVNKFQKVESFNEKLDWKLEDVMQEIASAINIYYKGVCVKHRE